VKGASYAEFVLLSISKVLMERTAGISPKGLMHTLAYTLSQVKETLEGDIPGMDELNLPVTIDASFVLR